MASEPDLIQKKVSNAFYTDEQLSKIGYTSGELSIIIVQFFMGGLWLGGNTYLTSTKLIFELNTLNKIFQSGTGDTKVEIPLVEVSQVTVKPSLGFKTIQLTIPGDDFKIRVKGAVEFASLIEETIAKAKSGKG